MDDFTPQVAIVDYGSGNLFSVEQACALSGLNSIITNSKKDILGADAVILPGVGAYGDAMLKLNRLDLVNVLRDIAESPKPFVGICLGLQLLMTESYEFGHHKGLGIIEGPVVKFDAPKEKERIIKVPQVGWNRLFQPVDGLRWHGTLLDKIDNGAYMYFVHSYTVQPQDSKVILSNSQYGHIEFCSSIQHRNVFACQFHPERSGPEGMKLYHNLAGLLKTVSQGGTT
jgi:imidazole glycerol-phosphate synthase subunit HisH